MCWLKKTFLGYWPKYADVSTSPPYSSSVGQFICICICNAFFGFFIAVSAAVSVSVSVSSIRIDGSAIVLVIFSFHLMTAHWSLFENQPGVGQGLWAGCGLPASLQLRVKNIIIATYICMYVVHEAFKSLRQQQLEKFAPSIASHRIGCAFLSA